MANEKECAGWPSDCDHQVVTVEEGGQRAVVEPLHRQIQFVAGEAAFGARSAALEEASTSHAAREAAGQAAFDACARAARPVLQQLAGMSDDRARLAQALLDAIPE